MCCPIDEPVPVAVDVSVQMPALPEQGALGLGVARVEFPHLGVEQVVEEERAVPGAVGRRDGRIKAAPPLRFLAGHKSPADGLGVAEDAGLDGFVFAGSGHRLNVCYDVFCHLVFNWRELKLSKIYLLKAFQYSIHAFSERIFRFEF